VADTAAADPDSSPESAAQRDSVTRAIRAAIEVLAPEQRAVLVLREFAGLSYRDIADIVETPIGTVMSRLSRARDELARSMRASHGEVQ
jgi:RNA polymerase sigma-70 factor, ECF subfamily